MGDEKSQWLEERRTISLELEKSPYNSESYLKRATCHERLGYPDLAASDAYRALLLTDEVFDEEGEYHDRVVEALETAVGGQDIPAANGVAGKIVNGTGRRLEADEEDHNDDHDEDESGRESRYTVVARDHARRSSVILVRALLECGDLKSAFHFVEMGLRIHPGNKELVNLKSHILGRHRSKELEKDPSWDQSKFKPREDLPEEGYVRREIYPWNDHEPDRFSERNLSFINAEIKKYAPQCEVRAVELPILSENPTTTTPLTINQLGIFTTAPIHPHTRVLLEPSVLTSSTRLHEPFCDACSTPLPPHSPTSPLPACSACEDTVFCSSTCHTRAMSLYHPAICGIQDYSISAYDPSPTLATSSLYTLLLARTIAMSETQSLHPLSLPQTKYLWGDFTPLHKPITRSLPFSFQNHIQSPLNLLSALSLDLFCPSTIQNYDTWIINTLLAKFRGVANAKMNERTGVPEVAGVHWLWSLANHSCAPNVKWEWERGGMGFVSRGGGEVVRWGPGQEGNNEEEEEQRWKGGLAVGEEVLNHYCDVDLSVRARREWAERGFLQ
ncbi:hypothetical protein JMJ35_001939 [Cladonia borealis]|uniref:MYND-type domain-containing protein n=1 Tax=Cladonia borealis TaxID=184061 RepID=A0AA39R6U1_9LECA|nr:hypothetical protein JMJ35_001939 [Cladonia borealis]